MSAIRSSQTTQLTGTFAAPGDKSVSHRALMLSALCIGKSRITGLLEGEDVLATAAAMRAMGATLERQDDGTWVVQGVGVGGLSQPTSSLDMGNSGTAVRLLMGLVASYPMDVEFKGDASLCARPMDRIIDPLRSIGADFEASEGNMLPLVIHGTPTPLPTDYDVPVPSAQVKSAVILAGLNTPGTTTVTERKATRDHTENMLRAMGADISVAQTESGGRRISLTGPAELSAQDIVVPGDPSSAAFLIVAALTTPGSKMTVTNVGTNPLRTGLFQTLTEMGADLTMLNERVEGGEPVADIQVSYAPLKGVRVPADRAPSMIDEYPILAIAAAAAVGDTLMEGLGELRVKESDRLAAIVYGLLANGVSVESGDDWLRVVGTGGNISGGGTVATHLDHRIAMAFLVMGCSAKSPITIDEDEMIATSFPTFLGLMGQAGAEIVGVTS